jgi:hypothetical protein
MKPIQLSLFGKMSQGQSLATTVMTFRQFYGKWRKQGVITLNGECWTHSGSESHSAEEESLSLLSGILQSPTQVGNKYFLSPRATKGILNRASQRGKDIPPKLLAALQEIAGLSEQESPSINDDTLTEVAVFHDHGFSLFKEEPETAGTLAARDYKDTRHYVIEKHAIMNDEESEQVFTFYSSQGKQDQFTESISTTLKASSITCIATSTVVRRLTEIESERLMGWDDDHTRFRADGKETPKSQRYKMCGNGVAAPVATWIGERIVAYLGDSDSETLEP